MSTSIADELGNLTTAVAARAQAMEPVDWAARAREAADLSAAAIQLLERIEEVTAARHPKIWDEAVARREIPLFKAWYDVATGVKELRSACRANGSAVEGGEAFYHAYNRSKVMALHFDDIVESNRRIDAGEWQGVPLQKVVDERRDRT